MESAQWTLTIPRNSVSPTFYHSETFGEYAEAYYLAAQKLWDSIPKSGAGVPGPDYLILPVLFLLHHYMELELKELIRLSYVVGSAQACDVRNVPDTSHDLNQLLQIGDSNLDKLKLAKHPYLNQNQRDLIADLQTFGDKGEALRYPVRTRRRGSGPTMPESFVADVAAVMCIMNGIHENMGGPIGYLIDIEQIMFEQYLETQR